MADSGQRSEKPTKRRLDKARQEGRFVVSREFVGSVQFFAVVWLFTAFGAALVLSIENIFRIAIREAFAIHSTRALTLAAWRGPLTNVFAPLAVAGAVLVLVALAIHLGTTGLGFSLKKLAPDFTRLNPASKLSNLPKDNAFATAQAVLLIPLFGAVLYLETRSDLDALVRLPLAAVPVSIGLISDLLRTVAWKFAVVFFLFGCVDLFRAHRKHSASMRMTKHEVREESKETEGNPQMKARIRRLQRDAARRNMMKEVPRATAVVVNPTHFAVAVRYDLDSMAAPRVVAKGKNYLALRIRQIATENQVPIIENPPLAQALYKSADVGQEIPPHLYRAVAEVLAYIFKLTHGRRA